MPELRLTLLVVGLVFLAGLAWWELRRPHQARGSDLPRTAPDAPERTPDSPAMSWTRSPDLELPRMSARYPDEDLPVVEMDPAEFAALEARAESTPLPAQEASLSLDDPNAVDPMDPVDPVSTSVSAATPATGGREDAREPVPEAATDAATPAMPVEAPEVPVTPVVVDWPEPDASQVIAVRVVSMGEKFPGRAVRLAVAAEGFELGKFSIFHKPAPDGRALLSIAGLTKPGTFDAHSMDVQRFSGLNLFTVLPGPMPGVDAVDELLMCAQVLSQRLRGALQDEQGEPLSPARTAVMRNAAAAARTDA